MTGARRPGWIRWGFYALSFVVFQLVFWLYRRFATNSRDEKETVLRVQIIIGMQMVLAVTSFFIWRRVLQALKEVAETWRGVAAARAVKVLLLLFLVLSHLAPFAYTIPPTDEPYVILLLSLICIALYLHILIFFLIGQIFLVLSAVANRVGVLRSFSRRYAHIRSVVTLVAVGISLTLVLIGVFGAFAEPNVKSVDIPIMKHDSSAKLVLLTDVHIGPSVGLRRTRSIADVVNALNPDLSDGFVRDLKVAANPLCHLKSKYGVYFSTGNHEYGHGNVDEWFELLRSCNITVLHNENRRVSIEGGETLCMAGIDDLTAARSGFDISSIYLELLSRPGHAMNHTKALTGCKDEDTVVLLAHQPNAAQIVLDDSSKPSHVDLILSGHTHAGQMYPLVPLVRVLNSFVHGLYKWRDTYVYVSAGVNFFGPPVKIFGLCEVTDIQLSPSKNSH